MSRQYQFDDESLREILELAYQHGFSEGYSYGDWKVPWPPSQKAKEMARDEINRSTGLMDYGAIVGGKEPDLPWPIQF